MGFSIKTSGQFEKDFAALDSIMQCRVLVILEQIKINPYLNVKKLKNLAIGIFRKRIGDYRLRYDVFNRDIYLYRIRHRKDVYKK